MAAPVDPVALAAADPGSVELLWLDPASQTWTPVPSALDAPNGLVVGYHNVSGTFIAAGLAARVDSRPRVVLDVNDDSDAALWDGERVFELDQSLALATSVKTMLEESCAIDVTLTRSGPHRFVNADLRADRAAAANPDLLLSIGFYSGDGMPSGAEDEGGPRVAALNSASGAFASTLGAQLETYTGRPAGDDSALPHPAEQGFADLAPVAAHVDVFELDNNFDHAVYATDPGLAATATANAIAIQLSDLGGPVTAACVNTLDPGAADDDAPLIDLGYSNGTPDTVKFDGTLDGNWVEDNTTERAWVEYQNGPVLVNVVGTWGVAEWPAAGQAGSVVVVGCWRYDRPMGYAEWHAGGGSMNVLIYFGNGGIGGPNLAPRQEVFGPTTPGPLGPGTPFSRYQYGPICSWVEFWAEADWPRTLYVEGTAGWHAPANGMALHSPLGPPPTQEELDALARLGYTDFGIFGVDPVDLASGNFVTTESLFTLTGVGDQSIDLSLNYNSADVRTSPVGVGWNFGYSTRAQKYDNGSVLLTMADGRSVFFESDGNGALVRPAREHMAATVNGNALTVSMPDGSHLAFSLDASTGLGRLDTVADRQGNTLTLAYAAPSASQDPLLPVPPLASITDEAGQVVTIGTNAEGYITSFAQPDGRVWSLDYDASGHLASITDAADRERSFVYDAEGRMTTVTGADGVAEVTNAFDSDGRVISQLDGAGNMRMLSYSDSNVTSLTDALGYTSTIHYNAIGEVEAQTDALGGTTDNTYDASYNPVVSTDANGNDFASNYDLAGRVVTYEGPLGETVAYTYNPAGDVTAVTSPSPSGDPATTTYVLNADGRPVETHFADGAVDQATYDEHGDITSFTDAAASATTYGYDDRGNIILVTDPLGSETSYAYDLANRQVGSTDPLGYSTSTTWDAANNVVSSVDVRGNTTAFAYDVNNSLVSQTDANGATTTFEYNVALQVTAVNFADGTREERRYDAENHLIGVTNPGGSSIALEYDALGQATAFVDEAGARWETEYDAVGNPVAQVRPDGTRTEATYDAVGRVTAITDALGHVTQREYNLMGQVSREVDALGRATTYEDDVVGRLTRLTEPDGTATTFGYDAAGNMVSATDAKGNASSYEYDALGRRVASVDRVGNRTVVEYDALGRVTATVNPEGARSETSYDAAGNPVGWVDALGNATSAQYDALGNRTVATDALGGATTTAYDALGRAVAITAADGTTETYTYDARGAIATHTDARGFTTEFAYDAVGREAGVTDATGAVWSSKYDSVGNLVATVDPTGARTKYSYDAIGQQIRTRDALGGVTTIHYDANGNVVSTVDPEGNKWRYAYDAAGRVVKSTSPSGAVTKVKYDANGNPVRVTDPNGVALTYHYDDADRVVKQTDPDGGVQTLRLNGLGAVTKVIDADGNVTKYEYDLVGRVTRTVDPEGFSSSYAYDAAGNTTSFTDERGGVSTYAYDALGRATSATDPTGATRTTSYDENGNVVEEIDPLGTVTTHAYDARGNATSTVENAQPGSPPSASTNVTTQTTYDPRGLQTAVTDPRGNTKTFDYDALGRLTTQTDALGRTTTTAYDAAGRVLATGAADGTTTSYGYNADGALSSVTYPDQVVAFGYDAAGNRTSMTDAIGTSTWTYDWAGRVTADTDATGTTTTRTYDAAGNETGVTYGDGRTVTRTFDGRGLALSQTDASGTTSFAYDRAGALKSVERPSGVGTTIRRDDAGRIVAITHAPAEPATDDASATFKYTYDAGGLVTSRKAIVNGAKRTTTYTHDALGRLVESKTGRYDATYSWDATSNLVGETRSDDLMTSTANDGWSDARTVNAANQLVTTVATPKSGAGNKVETTTFSYDARGNRSDAVTTTPQRSGGTTTVAEQHFAYDARNLLVAQSGDIASSWTRDGLGRALAVNEVGTTSTRAYDGYALVHDGDTAITPAPYGGVLTETTSGASVDVLADAQGSAVLTATGGVIAADLALFGDFGDVLDGNPPATDTGFTGQSSVGGLLEFASRSYDPSSRTWLQSDSYPGTLARSSSQNAYAYVEGAPETFVDVLGFWRGQDAFDAYLASIDGNNGKPFAVSVGEFVENHQGDIVGSLFTVGCTVVTGGSGVLACVAAGSAISASMNYIADTPAEDRTLGGLAWAVTKRVVVDVALTVATVGLARLAAPVVRAAVSVVPAPVRSTISGLVRAGAEKLPATAAAVRKVASGIVEGAQPWKRTAVRQIETSTIEVANAGKAAAGEEYVYRALNTADRVSIDAGLGISAKNPEGSWSLGKHVVRGSSPASWSNDPWIATTRLPEVAQVFDSGNGVVRINLRLVHSPTAEAWKVYPRARGEAALPFQYSFWQQEVSVFQSIPAEAIG
jgi:RHS repeat-associated protein